MQLRNHVDTQLVKRLLSGKCSQIASLHHDFEITCATTVTLASSLLSPKRKR